MTTMQQYEAARAKHPGMVLLFRVGDFYQAFDGDVAIVAGKLGLTRTTQAGRPMCGFPHHQLECYLPKLLVEGVKVAVCDPMMDAEWTAEEILAREG